MAESLTINQVQKLLDALQARLDVILTYDNRAGILTKSIIARSHHLSTVLYPQAAPWVSANQGQQVFQKLIQETAILAEEMNDWHEVLSVLAKEYDQAKASLGGFVKANAS